MVRLTCKGKVFIKNHKRDVNLLVQIMIEGGKD